MRDYCRRLLQIVPPIDESPPGSAGALPTGQPDPDNPTIVELINAACDALNRMCRCGPVTTLPPISVPPVQPGYVGVYYVAYDTSIVNADDVNEVNNCIWVDSVTGQSVRLEPYAYNQGVRGFVPYQQYLPARVPIQFQLEGNALAVLPPPQYAGQIVLTIQEGLQDLINDTDMIPANSLGPSYQTAILFYATALICARMASDVEQDDRFTKYYPMAQEGYGQIYAWKNGFSPQAMQTFPDLWKASTLAQYTNLDQSGYVQALAGAGGR